MAPHMLRWSVSATALIPRACTWETRDFTRGSGCLTWWSWSLIRFAPSSSEYSLWMWRCANRIGDAIALLAGDGRPVAADVEPEGEGEVRPGIVESGLRAVPVDEIPRDVVGKQRGLHGADVRQPVPDLED